MIILKMGSIKFNTVGQLRKALEGVPDDRIIVPQVVAEDGSAWNMWAEFCPQVPQGTIACLQLTHIELKSLQGAWPVIKSSETENTDEWKIIDKDGIEIPDDWAVTPRTYDKVKILLDRLNLIGENRPYTMVPK